jgi:hypothetical protein
MGSLAFQQPALIESSIRYDAERESFRVALYEAQRGLLGFKKAPRPVSIEVSQADLVAASARTGNLPTSPSGVTLAIWPAVIETAYAKHASKPGESLAEGFEHIGHGGWPKDALYALTGKDVDQLTDARLKDRELSDVYEGLKKDLDEHRPIILTTRAVTLAEEDGLVTSDQGAGHAYMVEGIRRVNDQIKLTVRNPWGHNMDPTHGIHTQDPTVEVDLETITDNGHIQIFDRGAPPTPSDTKPKHENQERISPQNEVHTGDRELDALLNSLDDPGAMSVALHQLAASSEGQQFREIGKDQYAEQERQQENMRQMAAQSQCAPVRSGPVMCR